MTRLSILLTFVWLATVPLATAAPFEFGGGGGTGTDCLSVFFGEANFPSTAPRHFRCADGDTCDADGVVNGRCTFPVAVCLNDTFAPTVCDMNGVAAVSVAHAIDDGDPKFDPEFQALQTRINGLDLPSTIPDACTLATNFTVSVKGPFFANLCFSGTKTLRLEATSTPRMGRVFEDADTVRLRCDPSPVAGCDPLLFFGSTFDRIQRQIFDQSCALSGCHDSQSRAAGLLLESGAAFANLVGVVPTNAAALAAGWNRVTPGDPAASLLHRKLMTLPSTAYGARMPRGKPRLNHALVTVIERWIEAGAPETGWVPGTF